MIKAQEVLYLPKIASKVSTIMKATKSKIWAWNGLHQIETHPCYSPLLWAINIILIYPIHHIGKCHCTSKARFLGKGKSFLCNKGILY